MQGAEAEPSPKIFGIVNVTDDSFSDGGLYRDPEAALDHARSLVAGGAYAVDLGAAASNPDARPVEPAEEIRRLAPILDVLAAEGVRVCVDSWKPETQRYCLERGVAFLNDIRGFPDAGLDEELAASDCGLIVMHSTSHGAIAERRELGIDEVLSSIYRFFDERIGRLTAAGVAPERLILDPGMGLFLSSDASVSFAVLARLDHLKSAFGLPVLVSVSRKSFLASVCGRSVAERGAATLGAEIAAVLSGADYIRTHDVRTLADALAALRAVFQHAEGSR